MDRLKTEPVTLPAVADGEKVSVKPAPRAPGAPTPSKARKAFADVRLVPGGLHGFIAPEGEEVVLTSTIRRRLLAGDLVLVTAPKATAKAAAKK